MKGIWLIVLFTAVIIPISSAGWVDTNVTEDHMDQSFHTQAVESNGNAHYVWNTAKQEIDGEHWYTWYCKWDVATGQNSPPQLIGDSLGSHQPATTPSVAIDSENTLHVVWSEEPWSDPNWSEEKRKIMYTRKYANGRWQRTPTQISDYYGTQPGQSSQCKSPHITVDQNGDIHVVWEQRVLPSPSHKYLDIFWNFSTDGGDSWIITPQGNGIQLTDAAGDAPGEPERDHFLPSRSHSIRSIGQDAPCL